MLQIIGVRHHSPACARLVREAIRALRPAYVLIEGPADMNARLPELLLGHELPIAVFTSAPAEGRSRASWSPLCDYSPEWIALTEGHAVGAEVRFMDLPAWHDAFALRINRYADDERRFDAAVTGLCAAFGMDNTDTLWDHLAEIDGAEAEADPAELTERLNTYFDLLRAAADGPDDDAPAAEPSVPGGDAAREAYMASWIRAALGAAGERPVLAVCGGFHRPALLRLVAESGDGSSGWPEVPAPDDGVRAVSYLVPYSFRRLDAFEGYQSGMPSPAYYQQLWEHGPRAAGAALTQEVAGRLRERRQPVSTADLIAARVTAEGLAAVRGHRYPGRADLLDGLVSALVGEALDEPLPWTGRGRPSVGTHPAVVEMLAALSGHRVGRLHPDTPLPPLVHDLETELERHLGGRAAVRLDLTVPAQREISRLLHRIRVLLIPGVVRHSGPTPGVTEAVFEEEWRIRADENRLAALIEAGGYGATVAEAAAARLDEEIGSGESLAVVARALFDAVLCGIDDLSDRVLSALAASIGAESDLGGLGAVLGSVLALWRHDVLLGSARSQALGSVIEGAVDRLLWLTESVRGTTSPAEPRRILAVRAVRDAVLYGGGVLAIERDRALAVMARIAVGTVAPPDLRGAAYGFGWSLGGRCTDATSAARGAAAPGTFGDWLAGLFALAREQILDAEAHNATGLDDATGPAGLLSVIDDIVARMSDRDLLIALPALRQAFTYFPPRERETIADHLLRLHGVADRGRALLRRSDVDPLDLARGRELDSHVEDLLQREGLLT